MHRHFPENLDYSQYQTFLNDYFHYSTLKYLIVDRQTLTIIDANQPACTFYGYESATLIGLDLHALTFDTADFPHQLIQKPGEPFDTYQLVNKHNVAFVHIERTALLCDPGSYELWVVTDLTEYKQTEIDQRRRYHYMNLLHDTNLMVMQQTDIDRVLSVLLEQISGLLDAAWGSLFLLADDYEHMQLRWSTSYFVDKTHYVVRGDGFIGEVWEIGKPLLINSFDAQQQHFHATIGLPIYVGDSIVGILVLAYSDPNRHFGESEIAVLEQACKLASLAIERAQFFTSIEAELVERRLIEQSLRKLMERFQLIEDVTASGIFDIDFKTGQIFTTVGFIETFGYSAADITTDVQQWHAIVHPDDVENVFHEFILALEHDDSFRCVFRLKKRDGAFCYVQCTLKFIRASVDRTLRRMVGSLFDITDRKKAEIAYWQSEERYRLSVQYAPYPIGVVRHKKLVFVNPCLLELANVESLTDFVHHPLAQFLVQQLEAQHINLLTEGEVNHLGVQHYIDSDQSDLYLDLTAIGIAYDTNPALLVIGHNVTGHRAAEETLRASAEQYRKMIEMAPMPIIVHSGPDILYANIRAIEGVALSTDTDIAGQQLYNYILPEDHEKLTHYLDSEVSSSSFRLLRQNGTIRVIEVTSTEIVYGDRVATQSAMTDITSRMQEEQDRLTFERRLLETQRLESLGILAGGIAHDFNNLLVAILGNADLALDVLYELNISDDVVEFVRHIEQAARRASELTNQMLMYSGRSVTAMRPVHIGKLVLDILELLKVSIAKTARLTCSIAEQPLIVHGDSAQLTQVIMNLVINASDALRNKPGSIDISIGRMFVDQNDLVSFSLSEDAKAGCYVWVNIADTGEGMTLETQSRMFDPFFTTKFTGRGLGLAAVQGIVRAHQGAIKVHSVLQQGTSIRLLFPCEIHDMALGLALDSMNKKTVSQGTMLVIDDEPDVRIVVERILHRLGFEVLSAGDGHAGIALFKEHHASITGVLLDLTMPDIDGITTLGFLREIDPQLRVILMSGYNEQQILEQFTDQHLAGFLSKPFMISDLRDRLSQMLE